jgi:hypothetical protein
VTNIQTNAWGDQDGALDKSDVSGDRMALIERAFSTAIEPVGRLRSEEM